MINNRLVKGTNVISSMDFPYMLSYLCSIVIYGINLLLYKNIRLQNLGDLDFDFQMNGVI